MRKKYISIGLIAVLMLAACSNSENTSASRTSGYGQTTVNDVLNEKIAQEEANTASDSDIKDESTSPLSESENDSIETANNAQSGSGADSTGALKGYDGTETLTDSEREAMTHDGIDLDLTVLSANMVYAEVYGMMVTPTDYEGKVVKMQGIYDTMHDASTNKDYYFCIIQDATACCAQGIEFILEDENAYPEPGSMITVIGTFEIYMEGESMYCTLNNSKIV